MIIMKAMKGGGYKKLMMHCERCSEKEGKCFAVHLFSTPCVIFCIS